MPGIRVFQSNKSIRSRVLDAVNKKIDAAELAFKNTCKAIDREAEEKKETAATELVKDIIGKVV